MSRAKGAMVASAIVCAAIWWESRGQLAAQPPVDVVVIDHIQEASEN